MLCYMFSHIILFPQRRLFVNVCSRLLPWHPEACAEKWVKAAEDKAKHNVIYYSIL